MRLRLPLSTPREPEGKHILPDWKPFVFQSRESGPVKNREMPNNVDAFKKISLIPVIDLLEVTRLEVKRRGLRRIGLLGTRVAMQTRFYGVLDGVEVIAPLGNLQEVHDAYVSMASAGIATLVHRKVFMQAGKTLTGTHGSESIMLAGTDLALMFHKGDDPRFDAFDCAEAHASVIANVAMD